MPTPIDLGLLVVKGVTRDGERIERAIYLSPKAAGWIRENLPDMAADGFVDGALAPREQLRELFRRFIVGDTFNQEYAPKPLTPLDSGVVELRTADLRLFGWFYRQREFIVSSVDRKVRLADRAVAYSGFVTEVCYFRDSLDLDGAKFIVGDMDDILRL